MAYLTVATALALLVGIQFTYVSACYYPSQYASNNGRTTSYYLGEMSLWDAKKGKRKRRNVISPLTLTHSMLLFRGKIFEWGIKKYGRIGYSMDRSPSSCKINWHWGSKGLSRCTRADAENWTRRYRGKYGGYNLLFNNCHMFVNRLAGYLNNNCGR